MCREQIVPTGLHSDRPTGSGSYDEEPHSEEVPRESLTIESQRVQILVRRSVNKNEYSWRITSM